MPKPFEVGTIWTNNDDGRDYVITGMCFLGDERRGGVMIQSVARMNMPWALSIETLNTLFTRKDT